MKNSITKLFAVVIVAQMLVSSTGTVLAQSYDDFDGGGFTSGPVVSGTGYDLINFDPSTQVNYGQFDNTSFTNSGTYFGTTGCAGCSGSGYDLVNFNPYTPVTYGQFDNTSFTNSGTYFGTTGCTGCGTTYSTPVTTGSTIYSTPVNYGTVDYGGINYGTVDYGTVNYGTVTYGNTGSWTGVVTTGCTFNCGTVNTTCPSGTTLVNGTCQINTVTCPAGTDRVNNTCVPHTQCPTGTTLQNNVCVPSTQCPAGTTLINGTCQINTTQCPTGTHRVNNTCVVDTTTCPSGSTLINGVCQAPITCPAGTTYQNGTCVGQGTTVCPAGSTLVNGVCQINTTSCPAGSTLQNGICVIQTVTQVTNYTCPNGQVVSNLYLCPVTYGQTSYGQTNYNYTSIPIIYQTCWDGSTIPNTSVCPSQYKVCANGTSVPIYQQCYVPQMPVYVPPPTIKFNNVVTSPATQITTTSARCNGIGLIAQGAQSTGWFEYGQTPNLGRSTAQAIIGNAATAPFSNVLTNLQPLTTYYCRAVMQNQYGLVKGEIVHFTTKGKVTTYVAPTPKKPVTKSAPVKKNEIVCSDGSVVSVGSQTSANIINQGQKLVTLGLEKVTGDLTPSGVATYRLTYKNLSDSALSGVVIKITLPEELENVSYAQYDPATHTATFEGVSMAPYSQNVIELSGKVAKSAIIGKTVVTTAYVLYTVPGTTVQDEVTAYTTSSITKTPDVATLSGARTVVGTGASFLPNTLVEWLALIAILFIIFILGRNIKHSYNKEDDAHH